MVFRIEFTPYMGHDRLQARGAQIFAAFRWLELGAHTASGRTLDQCEFILCDGIEAHCAARSLVPPRMLS